MRANVWLPEIELRYLEHRKDKQHGRFQRAHGVCTSAPVLSTVPKFCWFQAKSAAPGPAGFRSGLASASLSNHWTTDIDEVDTARGEAVHQRLVPVSGTFNVSDSRALRVWRCKLLRRCANGRGLSSVLEYEAPPLKLAAELRWRSETHQRSRWVLQT